MARKSKPRKGQNRWLRAPKLLDGIITETRHYRADDVRTEAIDKMVAGSREWLRKHKNVPDKINPNHYKSYLRISSTFNPGFQQAQRGDGGIEYAARLGAEIQVVDVIECFAPQSPHLGHALTYLLRAGEKVEPGETQQKATIRDLEKARWWLGRMIEYLGGPPNPDVK